MELSAGSHALFAIAIVEAIVTQCKEVMPEHLFIALCKAAEFDEESLAKLVKQVGATPGQCKDELSAVQDLLRRAGVDMTKTRRRLRELLLRESSLRGQFGGHRSQPCRDIFHAADSRSRVMGESATQAAHFLWAVLSSAGPLIRQAVGEMEGAWGRLCEICNVSYTPGREMPPPPAAPGRDTGPVSAPAAVLKDSEAPAAAADQAAGPAQPAGPQPSGRPSTPLLDKFGRDLTALARQGKLSPCVGRKEEMRLVAQTLRRRGKNTPVLVGDPGVGKTCVVEGLAQRVVVPGAPEMIRDWRIVEIAMSTLIAGCSYQGMFEQRLETMIKEVQSDSNLILFVDELHTMVGTGGGHDKGMDAGQILKPALARGDIRLIGATTTAEYRKYIEPDAALERRFQVVWVNEPSRDEAIEILEGLRPRLEQHHKVRLGPTVIERAVGWSMRYLPDHRLPDKAIDLIDHACAARMIRTLSPAREADDVTIPPGGAQPALITEADLAHILSERCQIPVGQIAENEADRLLRMEEALARRVKGQPRAIGAVADAIRTARAGLKKPNRPVGVFLFLGPTGTGKTELAKALADFLFGTEDALIRFDMSEYGEKHNVSRLIGAPPGYIGHDEEGQLTGRVRTRPYSVILFDEIEKAHSDVFDIFLQIFDDGRLTDSKGRRALFTESIIAMTSNLGVGAGAASQKDFGISIGSAGPTDQRDQQRAERERQIEEALKRTFRPELLNRIDRKVLFDPLSRETVAEILDKIIANLNARLAEQRIKCECSQPVKDLLLDEGYSEAFGARELERAFDRLIATPLARALLEKRIESGRTVRAELRDGEICFV